MRSKTNLPDKIYDSALITKIANQLGIQAVEQVTALQKILEESAKQFFWQLDYHSRFTKKQTSKKFKQLSAHMKKVKILFDEATKNSLSGTSDFNDGILHLDKQNPYRELLWDIYRKHEYFITPENISSLLESLQLSFQNASLSQNNFYPDKWNKTQLVLSWIWSFDEFWETHSKVPITEGKHVIIDEVQKITGYKSSAIDILTLIVEPINLYTNDWKITNSMLGEAIKLRRNSGDMVREIDLSDEEFEKLIQ